VHSHRVGPESLVAKRVEAENALSVAHARRIRRPFAGKGRILSRRSDGHIVILTAA
jgi:hypothetical protein